MFLYLVQHAEAKREEEDPARDLTATGRQDIEKVAHYVGNLPLTVSRIWHSGKTRALRTAEILAASLKPAYEVSATDGLAPLDDPVGWADRLTTSSSIVASGLAPLFRARSASSSSRIDLRGDRLGNGLVFPAGC